MCWSPVISLGALMIYRAGLFSDWRGNAFVAGLPSRAIVRIRLLPSGPIAFYDVAADNALVPAVAGGRAVQVVSGDARVDFDLAGADGAVATIDRCFEESS